MDYLKLVDTEENFEKINSSLIKTYENYEWLYCNKWIYFEYI